MVLLDTCAVMFIAENQPIDATARQQIAAASAGDGILVSPVSAWEIGLLASKRRLVFLPTPIDWFNSFLANPGVRLTPLTPKIAVDCSFLPPLHSDPVDRLLVATARAVDVPIVTRDDRILGYAQAGFVRAIQC